MLYKPGAGKPVPPPLPSKPLTPCQMVGDQMLSRKHHVWVKYADSDASYYKCVTCGAITHEPPPGIYGEEDWLPEKYERLEDSERAMCPWVAQ